jgi:hypothetical protein
MTLKPGAVDSNDNFIDPDCMAKYIEDAMPKPPDPDIGKHDRRQFLIAFSTGIIKYLKAHESDSFLVKVQVGTTDYPGTFEIL